MRAMNTTSMTMMSMMTTNDVTTDENESSVFQTAGSQQATMNFMDLIPVRMTEHIQKDWQVGFREPRFQSKFWNRFFMTLGASEHLVVRLDRMGSEIFGHIDGERNVRRILTLLEINHKDEDDLRDRLVAYLKRLEHHEYIELRIPERSGNEQSE
jgi:hypothetical protein